MRIGIDMTWLKPKKSGGVESYIRNLLDGFLTLSDKNEYVLFVAKDNKESLIDYANDSRVSIVDCNTNANDVKGHLLWQNMFQYRVLKKNNIDFCFFPVYEMPAYKNKNIKCVTAIQDIQAYHYPEYFSKLENIWFRFAWKRAVKCADRIVTTTEYTKSDVIKNIGDYNNITSIYIPIVLNNQKKSNFKELAKRYNIEKDNYYYTVSSLYKHKNLMTLILMMKKIKEDKHSIPEKLVISGVGGPQKKEIENKIKEMNLEDNVIFTDFISNEERNSLMNNCNVFLFSSTFEGFGMPPIEAMQLGSKVITTKCTAIPEVTQNKCTYVKDPYDITDWIKKIKKVQQDSKKKINFPEYEKEKIARQYLDLFYQVNAE